MLEVHVTNTDSGEEMLSTIGENESAGLILTTTDKGDGTFDTFMTGYFSIEEGLSFIAHLTNAISQRYEMDRKLILDIVKGAMANEDIGRIVKNEQLS